MESELLNIIKEDDLPSYIKKKEIDDSFPISLPNVLENASYDIFCYLLMDAKEKRLEGFLLDEVVWITFNEKLPVDFLLRVMPLFNYERVDVTGTICKNFKKLDFLKEEEGIITRGYKINWDLVKDRREDVIKVLKLFLVFNKRQRASFINSVILSIKEVIPIEVTVISGGG